MRARAAWAALICIVAVDAVIAVANLVRRTFLNPSSQGRCCRSRAWRQFGCRGIRNGKPGCGVYPCARRKGNCPQRRRSFGMEWVHGRFKVKRINHQETCSLDGACTNWAEEYFSRLRRAEIGIHHHIAGAYLLRHAQESSWREDNRRVSNVDQVSRAAT